MTVAALLFTDLVDSTRLVERLGDAEAARVWAEHDRRARDLLARHGGREIDRADGFFLLFDAPASAACYALAYHPAIADLGLEARVGLHVGTVSLHENAPEDVARGAKLIEVEGVAKPLAARIMALAGGGQTLLSTAARTALGDTLPDRSEIRSHGHYRLKGLEEPVEVLELGRRGGAAFSPPADADKAFRVVRVGELWHPLREIRHNLAAERDTFVGRVAELRHLAQRLDAGTRLLTLLGPSGTGKTRLACRYGRAWLGEWPGGIYFCDLSEARTLDGVCFALALALEIPLGKDDAIRQLGHAIAGRGRCLVILDNFEQVVEHAAATLGRWLDRAADAAFVVTSRERLHLPGEEVCTLEPLPLESEAIELFATRARSHQAGFALGDANRAAVAEIVRLLDGLPLAIELAAARMRVLSPAQLVQRLGDRFRILGGARSATARQATLEAAIDWSWNLLAPWEQSALAQCSVFEGGFTLMAAEAVFELPPAAGDRSVMDAVQSLVDKSLLRTWSPGEQGRYDLEEPYFGMYLSIREYAAHKLRLDGDDAQRRTQRRHGSHFAGFGTDEAVESLFGHGGVRGRRALAFELDNLVAACSHAIARGDGPTAVGAYRAAWEVLDLQGSSAVGVRLGDAVLALGEIDPTLRAIASLTRAQAAWRAGRAKEAETGLAQALALSRDVGARRREGLVLDKLGMLHREQGRLQEARATYEAALAIHREVGHRRAEGSVLGSLGSVDSEQGRMDEAQAKYAQALAIHREVGNRREEGMVLGNLGTLHREQGRVEEARRHYEHALAIHRELGDRRSESHVLGNLGIVHREQGRMDLALALFESDLAISRELGDRRTEGVTLGNLGGLYLDQGRVDEARQRFQESIAISTEVGNRRNVGVLMGHLGELHLAQGRMDEARVHFEQALAIARAAGQRRHEAFVLGSLGVLHRREQREVEAQAHFEAALAIHRQVGDRRAEGFVLGSKGELLIAQGRLREAREALLTGEALLREVGDPLELAKLLCIRGRADRVDGDSGSAHAALAEAEALAATLGAPADSELGLEIAGLRAALA